MTSTSATHRCLQITEIMHMVMQQFYPSSRQSLPAVARTCRAFYEPAMDVLWHSLDDLSPLIKCMPSDLWQEEESTVEFEDDIQTVFLLTFTREIVPEDWVRIKTYSWRVKELAFDRTYNRNHIVERRLHRMVFGGIGLYAIAEMEKTGPRFSLLPNLRKMRWPMDLYGNEILGCIPLISGLHLSTLIISSMGAPINEATVDVAGLALRLLTAYAPVIEDLTLLLPSHAWEGVTAAASYLVKGQPHLRRFKTKFMIDADAITHLATRRHLSCLHLTIEKDDKFDFLEKAGATTLLFPALRELNIDTDGIEALTAFAKFLTPASLEQLSVSCQLPESSASDIRELFEVLSKQPRLKKLVVTARKFRLLRNCPYRPAVFAITPLTLAPLLRLKNITEFCLRIDSIVDLDDAFIEGISKAWPHLTLLEIPSLIRCPTPRLTLGGVLCLAQGCRALCELSLTMDATVLSKEMREAVKQGKAPQCERLNMLEVYSSPVGDAAETGEILLSVFPALMDVFSMDCDDMGGWAEIEAEEGERRPRTGRIWRAVGQWIRAERKRRTMEKLAEQGLVPV